MASARAVRWLGAASSSRHARGWVATQPRRADPAIAQQLEDPPRRPEIGPLQIRQLRYEQLGGAGVQDRAGEVGGQDQRVGLPYRPGLAVRSCEGLDASESVAQSWQSALR